VQSASITCRYCVETAEPRMMPFLQQDYFLLAISRSLTKFGGYHHQSNSWHSKTIWSYYCLFFVFPCCVIKEVLAVRCHLYSVKYFLKWPGIISVYLLLFVWSVVEATVLVFVQSTTSRELYIGLSICLDLADVEVELLTSHEHMSSLARFDFQQSQLRFESRSDTSKDIDLVSHRITVSDTRYQGTASLTLLDDL